METVKKFKIEWNVHRANDIETNPVDFLYCFQGDSTRDHCVHVHKVVFQPHMHKDGYALPWDDVFKSEYFILHRMIYSKKCEEYDPYGDKWYLNYTSLREIAGDYDHGIVFRSFEELEKRIENRVNELAYMLSHISESTEEAQEAAERTKILSISAHEMRYDGYVNYKYNEKTDLETVLWYFNEFASSIGILSAKIRNGTIHLNMDREGRATFTIRNDKGYLKHWRTDNRKGTLHTAATENAFEAVKWLLERAYYELPLHERHMPYRRG